MGRIRFYVIKSNKLTRLCIGIFIIVLAFIAVAVPGVNSLQVFSASRELPIYSVDCGEKKVAITFDCAWGADDIPQIVNTLKDNDIRATFFFVGQWAAKNPDEIRLVAENGNDIGNHSYSHLRMGTLDASAVKKEITEGQRILSEVSGKKVELFRAPYGDYNDTIIRAARDSGCFSIQWDVDSLDWNPDVSREEILGRIMRNIKSGSILLFHNDTKHTADLLPEIINMLKREGYGFLPVSELILRNNYYIDFEGRQRKND